jgi:Family of unknown function (DUF6144)
MPFGIARFLDSLKKNASVEEQEKLLQNRVPFEDLSTATQASKWIGSLMDDMVACIGVEKAKLVMEPCGQQCIGQSILEKARSLYNKASDIDEFIDKLNEAHIGGGKLRRENNIIHASYEQCYCGSVSKSRTPISTVYCQCSCGWYKQLFESTLAKPVKVELVDSIIHGADKCQFIIHL